MKVALVNINGNSTYKILDGRANAGLNVLEDALTLKGHDVALFPMGCWSKDTLRYIHKLAKNVVDYSPDAVGISCVSQNYADLAILAYAIKKRANIPIVAGGPHFRFDYFDVEKDILNPVMFALTQLGDGGVYSIDGVVAGGGGAFVSYMGEKDSHPEGFYRFDGNSFIGSGEGSFPQISRAPFAIERIKNDLGYWGRGKKKKLLIFGHSKCPNECGYCVIDNRGAEIPPAMIEKTLPKKLSEFSHITLGDSSPFFYIPYYDEVFSRIRKKDSDIPIAVFLDPSTLNRDGFYRIVERHRLMAFYVGRDVSDHDSAVAIGRNYLGKVRSQEQLDQEREYLLNFLKFLGKTDLDCIVVFSYIFSPFDSKAAILRNLFEMEQFDKRSPENVKVAFVPMILQAWPGTEVRQKYIDKIADPSDYLSQLAYVWDPIQFPEHTQFFDEIRKIYGPANIKYDSIAPLKKRVKEIFR